jgi:hypothetical protein
MKFKKSKKMVQKTNIKINIGTDKLNKRRRRRRAVNRKPPTQPSFYQLPAYAVQQGSSINRDDFSRLINDSNEINTKRFSDLLKDQENNMSSRITKIEEMKTPELEMPPEYLKIQDLERFYSNFKGGLPNMIKDIIKSESPVKTLSEVLPESKSDDSYRAIFGPIEDRIRYVPAVRPERATFHETKDDGAAAFVPLEEDEIMKSFRKSSKKSTKKPPRMTRGEALAIARAAKAKKKKDRDTI